VSAPNTPSDPDAAYDGHKGKGYQVQIAGTYSEDANTLKLITHINLEKAFSHDSDALIPAIDSLKEKDPAPTELLADTAHGCDTNWVYAQENGVALTTPVAGLAPNRREKSEEAELETETPSAFYLRANLSR
jgi:hypothetical protein